MWLFPILSAFNFEIFKMEDDYQLTMTRVMRIDDFCHNVFVQNQIIFIKFRIEYLNQ